MGFVVADPDDERVAKGPLPDARLNEFGRHLDQGSPPLPTLKEEDPDVGTNSLRVFSSIFVLADRRRSSPRRVIH